MHLNIRSIGCNFNELQVLLKRINIIFDVLVLSECWLSKCPYLPTLPGYSSFKTKHTNQNDGVVAYVKANLPCTVYIPTFSDANCLVLKFANDSALVALYRSPSQRNISIFLNSLDQIIKSLSNFKTISVIGDININILPGSGDPNSDTYLTVAAANGMLPAHIFPTRNNNCLDHVLLKAKTPSVTLVIDSFITDHAPIIFCCSLTKKISKAARIKTMTDEAACVNDIENTDYSFIMAMTDAENAANALVINIISIINTHSRSTYIPSKSRIIKPWMTPGLLRCIRNRDRLHKLAKKDPDNHTARLTYSRYRNYCTNLLKKIKQAYERLAFQKVKHNPKATWGLIKNTVFLNNKTTSATDLLQINTNPIQSVDTVNKYFSTIGSDLANKFVTLPQYNTPLPQAKSRLNSMALISTDNDEIERTILNLKNCSLGWDTISASLLKATRRTLVLF